ncbi:Signal recognition particle, SRP9/SRP14 subunit [Mycena venus]|uniref:Signal recognition particle subunit SRP14 n=1 Tax=Mycena venus TaxID=2733690 RepID=A0A8H7CR90_9AGAR|nr:Signal recognition particle, SRP9/SRP14 subunit [Mycena venus]
MAVYHMTSRFGNILGGRVSLKFMELLDHDSFLQRLTALFESSKEHGSIWLTHKRLIHDGEDVAMASAAGADDEREYPCLVRVTDGTAKFSTKVNSSELDKFHNAYGTLLKASMTTLRKRDKKREKQRAEQAARRKKKMTEPVVVDGPKRGNGRRKRQRQLKAAAKQEESQRKAKQREEAAKAKSTSAP